MDVDGRLHVSVANISKATVNPYQGSEIPNWQAMGLDEKKVYYLLRHPDELAKAVGTFNNLPLLSEHIPVNADTHAETSEFVVGCTGDRAAWDDPYLQNSLSVWTTEAIETINDDSKRELSSAYRYRADMQPGNFKGLPFDGIMRDIVGNHVALVEIGRAGPDVFVGDADMLKSRKGLMLSGALVTTLRPLLAADAKVDFGPALDGVTARNMLRRKDAIAKGVIDACAGKFAADGMDVEDVVQIIEAVAGSTDEPDAVDEMDPTPKPGGTNDADPDDRMAKVMNFAKSKMSEDDYGELERMASSHPIEAGDADPDDKDKDKDKAADADDPDDKDKDKAMDSATVRRMIDEASARTAARVRKEQTAIRVAMDEVKPLTGELVGAYDTAADVYKVALVGAKVDLADVDPSAYRSMVGLLRKTSERATPAIAADAAYQAGRSAFSEAFPKAGKLIEG